MITLLRWLLPAVIGILVGAASAWWATGGGMIHPVPGHSGWRTSLAIGSSAAGAYTRARIARTGLLALNRHEAVYYLSNRDHAGRPLRAACAYKMTGQPLPGRWWSITLYAGDQFLARNDDFAHVVSSDNVVLLPDGTWSIRIADSREGAGNWLSTRNSGHFSLVARIYQPSQAIVNGKVPDLPVMHRLTCRQGMPS